jgi:hypothetical protein
VPVVRGSETKEAHFWLGRTPGHSYDQYGNTYVDRRIQVTPLHLAIIKRFNRQVYVSTDLPQDGTSNTLLLYELLRGQGVSDASGVAVVVPKGVVVMAPGRVRQKLTRGGVFSGPPYLWPG